MSYFSRAAPRGMSAAPPWGNVPRTTRQGPITRGVPRVTEGPPDGCKHSPSCFTCPLPDCMVIAAPAGAAGAAGAAQPKRPRGRPPGAVGTQPKRYQCAVCGKLTSFSNNARTHDLAAHGGEAGFVTLAAAG